MSKVNKVPVEPEILRSILTNATGPEKMLTYPHHYILFTLIYEPLTSSNAGDDGHGYYVHRPV